MEEFHNYVAGKFQHSTGTARITVTNPATGAALGSVPESTDADLDAALDAAKAAQPAWGKLPPIERAKHLHALADLIRAKTEPLARTITEEQGKTLGLARVEVSFTADYIDYMAEWARRIEGEIIASDQPNENIFLFRQPIGVVGGILPWNFPFFLIARKMAPALVCGNAIVIKPSEETPLNCVEFCKIIDQSDIPSGLFNVVHGGGAGVGKAIASSPRVDMISFTGSVGAGGAVMSAASNNITKLNLELGGKAPAIVLSDADLDLAAGAIKDSRIINSGQVCNCAERIYVQRKVADEFTQKLVVAMESTRFGNPLLDETIDYGPLINEQGFKKVDRLVRSATDAGATVVTGGNRASENGGFYYEPTVIADCTHEMQIIQEEIFGPVAPIVVFDDLDEAIALANDSDYGLTSSIYTRDLNTAMRACNEIKFGETYINRHNFEAMQGYHAGVRRSGLGGADGKHGLYEYLQTHVVYLDHS